MVKNENAQSASETFAGQVFNKASEDNMTHDPNALELTKAAAQISWKASSDWVGNLWRKITQATIGTWNALRNTGYFILYALRRMKPLETVALAFCAIVFIAAYLARHRFYYHLSFLWQLYRCRRAWFSLERRTTTPRERICVCHDIAIALLRLAALKRPADRDLAEWAEALSATSPEVSTQLAPIAQAAAIVQFSDDDPQEDLAATAVNALPRLSHALSPFLSKAW